MQETTRKESDSQIFRKKEVLRLDYMPDEVLHRDKQISTITSTLKDFHSNTTPWNLLGIGPTGTGKTVVARSVAPRFIEASTSKGLNIRYAYVNCATHDTLHEVYVEILSQLRNPMAKTGYLPGQYVGFLREAAQALDGLVVILDEVDRLVLRGRREWMDLFYAIGRELPLTSAIMLTNNYGVPTALEERLDVRAKATFLWKAVPFTEYGANELADILRPRMGEAFDSSAYDEGTIRFIAAQCRKEALGARGLIEIARYAGELADSRGQKRLGEEFILEAVKATQEGILIEPILSLDPPTRELLYHIAKKKVTTQQEIQSYFVNSVAPKDGVGASSRAFYSHLDRLKPLGLLFLSRRPRSQGRGSEGIIEINPNEAWRVKMAMERDEMKNAT